MRSKGKIGEGLRRKKEKEGNRKGESGNIF